MKGILSKLLIKRGLKSVDDLEPEEKKTFDEWQAVLNKEELTVEDIKIFCRTQIDIIEQKWSDYNLDGDKKSSLIPYHTVYRTLLSAINSPKTVREALEMQLNQLLNA